MVTQASVKPQLKPFVFFKMDKEGYILNDTDIKSLKKPWTDVTEDIKEILVKYIGEKLHSIYIIGDSIKAGNNEEYREFVFLILTREETNLHWLNDYISYLLQKFPFIKGISAKISTYARVISLPDYFKFNIKSRFLSIWGNDICWELPKYKPGFNIAFETRRLARESQSMLKYLYKNKDDQEVVKKMCLLITRIILCSGFEVCMEKEKKYTVELYTCYRIFVKYHPDKEEFMRKVLHLNKNPSSDYREVSDLILGIGAWLVALANLIEVEKELKVYMKKIN